jgi:hypothetical protein
MDGKRSCSASSSWFFYSRWCMSTVPSLVCLHLHFVCLVCLVFCKEFQWIIMDVQVFISFTVVYWLVLGIHWYMSWVVDRGREEVNWDFLGGCSGRWWQMFWAQTHCILWSCIPYNKASPSSSISHHCLLLNLTWCQCAFV